MIDISVFSCLSNVCEIILAIKITFVKPLIFSKKLYASCEPFLQMLISQRLFLIEVLFKDVLKENLFATFLICIYIVDLVLSSCLK